MLLWKLQNKVRNKGTKWTEHSLAELQEVCSLFLPLFHQRLQHIAPPQRFWAARFTLVHHLLDPYLELLLRHLHLVVLHNDCTTNHVRVQKDTVPHESSLCSWLFCQYSPAPKARQVKLTLLWWTWYYHSQTLWGVLLELEIQTSKLNSLAQLMGQVSDRKLIRNIFTINIYQVKRSVCWFWLSYYDWRNPIVLF